MKKAAFIISVLAILFLNTGCGEPPYDGDCYSDRQCEELRGDHEEDSGCSASRPSSSSNAGTGVVVGAALLLIAASRRRKALLAVSTVALLALPSLAFAGGSSYDNGDSGCGGGASYSSSSSDSGCGGPSTANEQPPRADAGGCGEDQEPAPTAKDASDAKFWRIVAIIAMVVIVLQFFRRKK